MQFIRDRQLYHPDFFQFLFNVLRAVQPAPVLDYNNNDPSSNSGLVIIQLATK